MLINKNTAYLGDGVYATCDGYQIILEANTPTMTNQIALDIYTWRALVEYADRLWGKKSGFLLKEMNGTL